MEVKTQIIPIDISNKIRNDFCLYITTLLALAINIYIVPAYNSGFFCNDNSLKYPYKSDTVNNFMLYTFGYVFPIIIIIIIEWINRDTEKPIKYKAFNYEIPSYLIEIYKQVGIFLFGMVGNLLLKSIGKKTVGRLRPHFINVCQPKFLDGTDCSVKKNLYIYHEIFECTNNNSSKSILKEMRLSFPSGHSSLAFFAMTYLTIYLQSRIKWKGSKLFKHFLQLFLMIFAWYTALSRMSDNKHHWSDVAAGSLLGIFIALFVSKYISKLFDDKIENNIENYKRIK